MSIDTPRGLRFEKYQGSSQCAICQSKPQEPVVLIRKKMLKINDYETRGLMMAKVACRFDVSEVNPAQFKSIHLFCKKCILANFQQTKAATCPTCQGRYNSLYPYDNQGIFFQREADNNNIWVSSLKWKNITVLEKGFDY